MEKDVFATSIQEAMKDMTFSNTKDEIINHLRDTCDERGTLLTPEDIEDEHDINIAFQKIFKSLTSI